MQKLPGIQLQIIGSKRESVNFVKTVSEQSAVSEWNMIVPVYIASQCTFVCTPFGVVEMLERSWRNIEAKEAISAAVLCAPTPSFMLIQSQHWPWSKF